MKPGINVGNEGDWSTKPSSPFIFPERVKLEPHQIEFIHKALRTVGIDQSVIDKLFSGPRLPDELRHERFLAVAVYAAIKEATKGTYKLTRTFKQWSRDNGLPW